jgi:hypothetical protein
MDQNRIADLVPASETGESSKKARHKIASSGTVELEDGALLQKEFKLKVGCLMVPSHF